MPLITTTPFQNIIQDFGTLIAARSGVVCHYRMNVISNINNAVSGSGGAPVLTATSTLVPLESTTSSLISNAGGNGAVDIAGETHQGYTLSPAGTRPNPGTGDFAFELFTKSDLQDATGAGDNQYLMYISSGNVGGSIQDYTRLRYVSSTGSLNGEVSNAGFTNRLIYNTGGAIHAGTDTVQHIVFQRNSSTLQLEIYLNGVELGFSTTQIGTGIVNIDNTVVGAAGLSLNTAHGYQGGLDEIIFYNRLMTQQEITLDASYRL